MNHPGIVAASIAGGGIGIATGFMSKGEELENNGTSGLKQFTGSTIGGLSGGVVGTGIGLGVGGTALALRKILRK